MSSRNTPDRSATGDFAAPRIACVVLAAGAGTRFGAPGEKLLARTRGASVLQHCVDAACASRATSCALVVGAGVDRVLAHVDVRRAAVFRNEQWSDGLSSSIRLAVAAYRDADACLFTLGDAPHVVAVDLDRLIERWCADPGAIAVLRTGRVWGAPAIFGRQDFPALARLRGDRGAKAIARKRAERLRFVEASDRRAFADVDRRRDLKRSD